MKAIYETKIVTKIKELIAARQSTASRMARTICPCYQNPLPLPIPHAKSSAVLEIEKTAELLPSKRVSLADQISIKNKTLTI